MANNDWLHGIGDNGRDDLEWIGNIAPIEEFIEDKQESVKDKLELTKSTDEIFALWSTLSETEQKEYKQLFQERKKQLNK